jgi:hypothetical protein
MFQKIVKFPRIYPEFGCIYELTRWGITGNYKKKAVYII